MTDNKPLEDFHARKIRTDSLPAIIYIESVKGCPYSCIMCGTSRTPVRSISTDLLERVAPYFRYLKVLAIHGDGEPCVGDSIDYLIESAGEHDCMLLMNTTGFFLSDPLGEKLLRVRLNIRFSINAGRPNTYRKIMGADLAAVKKRIAAFVQRSARDGRPDNEFWLSFIVVRENMDEIDDFIRLADEIGIRNVRFMKLIPNSKIIWGASRGSDFTFKYFEQFNRRVKTAFLAQLPHINDLSRALGIRVLSEDLEYHARHRHPITDVLNKICARALPGVKPFPIRKRKGICAAPWLGQIQLRQNGDITLCCASDHIVGNLYRDGLDAIWNGERMRLIRTAFRDGYFPGICAYCNGMNYLEYNVPFS